MHLENKYFMGHNIIRVVFNNGENKKPVAWYRCYNRNVLKVWKHFLDNPAFYYAKVYQYNRKTKQVGKQIAWFNREQITV